MNFLISAYAIAYIITAGFPVQGSNHSNDSLKSEQQSKNSLTDTSVDAKLLIRPFYLDIVPPSSGVQFYKNGIIFLSHSKIEEKVPEKHLSFGSLRTFMALPLDTVPGEYMPFIPSAPNVFPSEATTFTDDFNTMYVSLIPSRDSREKIFRAILKSNNWVFDDEPLNFCKGNYIYSHPTVSVKDEFMIFSSDRVGTAGGLDLFISRKDGDKWSQPENIGKHINTSGNELFASLDADNNLYFSSDGIPGEGGYDIFICSYNGSGWAKPHNLSAAINSQNDEVAFTVSRDDKSRAFFTSRSKSGKNKIQLNALTLQPSSATDKNANLSKKLLAMAGIESDRLQAAKESTAPATLAEPVKKATQGQASGKPKPETAVAATSKKAPDTKKVATDIEKETAPASKSEITAPSSKHAIIAPAEANKDLVVYRVQILANTKPVGSKSYTVNGTSYKSFEYLYMGGYRTTIGECSTLAEAAALQNACRRNGYSQAFVVAFKNNIRSNDPALFK